jgi:hypothetical protein
MSDSIYSKGHAVDGMEDDSPISHWLEWSGDATCNVTKQTCPLYLDILTVRDEDLVAWSCMAWLAPILVKKITAAGHSVQTMLGRNLL